MKPIRPAFVSGPPKQGPPVCHGRRMILRFNARTGRAFYGCAAYPHCRATAPCELTEPKWFAKGGERR